MKIGLIGSAFRRDDPRGIAPELRAALDDGVDVQVYLPRVSRFPHNPFDLKLQELGYLGAGIDAADDGCDAIVLNTVGDYGLAALKAATRRPVVGAGETGMAIAASLGAPFAIVTVWPRSTDFLYAGVLREAGLAGACREIRYVGSETELAELGSEDDYVARMQRGEDAMVGRIVAECRAVVAAGARSVLLGCTCMSGVAHMVAQEIEVPLVNPMTVAVRHAVTLARLGLAQSREAFRPAATEGFTTLRAMLDGAVAAGTATGGDCEVCELVAAGAAAAGATCGLRAES